MRESKIVEFLKSFNHLEYKRLGDFVRSPFHNKNDSLILLYDYFANFSKDFNELYIDYNEIADFVFPDDKLNESRVRSLVSNFVKLIESFLSYAFFEKNSIFQKTGLLNALNLRNLPKNFQAVLNETIQYQKIQFNRDEDYYYNQIYIEVEYFNHFLERSKKIEEEDFSKINENMNLFFVLAKLNLIHFMMFHIQTDTETYRRFWLMNEIISYIEDNLNWISKEHPNIYMKYLILMTIVKPSDESYFRNLKKFVINNYHKFSSEVLQYVFGGLTNYCMVRCNGGDIGFKTERFKVYKLIDDNDLFSKEIYMHFVDFLNAIISATSVDKIAWAEKFFDKYKDKILPEMKEPTLALARTEILYHKKQYDEAIEVLNTVSYNNSYFYMRTKRLFVNIYYDMGNIEPIPYIIDAARHYLKRNTKISRINRELFLKFFNYMSRLINLDHGQKAKLKAIKYELIKEVNVSGKEWLLTKIEELEKNTERQKTEIQD